MGVPRRELLLAAAMFVAGCGRTSELTLQLERPLAPDPFFDVDRLQLFALVDGERVDLGRWRWDRGPVTLDRAITPSFERLVVVGLDANDAPVASGVSPVLDVVRDPPEGPVRVYFSAMGQLSQADFDLGPRVDGFAAARSDGVVFGGGVDAAGCARTDVVFLDARLEPSHLADLDAPRVGAAAISRSEGPIMLFGGLTSTATDTRCGDLVASDDVAFISDDGEEAQTAWTNGEYPREAAVVALDDGSFIIAGGRGDQIARTAVHLVDVGSSPPQTTRISTVGQMDRPRATAAALRLSNNRVAFAGGRATTSTRTLIADVSTFDLNSGRTVAVSTVFPEGRGRLASARLSSGALVFAGGTTPGGDAGAIDVVPVDPDATGALGAAERWGELAAPGTGRLLDLLDGSLLFVPDDPDADLTWVRLVPRAVRPIPRPSRGGAFVGEVAAPGLAVFLDERGGVFTFNAGAAGALARTASGIDAPAPHAASGLIPSQPTRVELEDGALRVDGPDFFSLDALPEQLVVVNPADVTDFELTLSYRVLEERARASIVYGLADGDYDHLLLETSPRVVRSPLRRGGGRVECDPVSLPQLAAVGPHRLRVRRSGGGRRLALDLGADGTEELNCDTPVPRSGAIALGVVNGRVAFDSVRLRIR